MFLFNIPHHHHQTVAVAVLAGGGWWWPALDVGAVRREITVLIARGATTIRILSCPTLLWGKLDRSEE